MPEYEVVDVYEMIVSNTPHYFRTIESAQKAIHQAVVVQGKSCYFCKKQGFLFEDGTYALYDGAIEVEP